MEKKKIENRFLVLKRFSLVRSCNFCLERKQFVFVSKNFLKYRDNKRFKTDIIPRAPHSHVALIARTEKYFCLKTLKENCMHLVVSTTSVQYLPGGNINMKRFRADFTDACEIKTGN